MSEHDILILSIFYGGLGLFVLSGLAYSVRLMLRAKRDREQRDATPLGEDITSGTITIPPGTRFANVRTISPAARDLAHRV